MITPSFVSFADGGGSESHGVGDGNDIPPNSTGVGNSLRGTNIIVSLISVENTTAPYRTQIDAHNAGSSDNWSEMSVAIVDNHLKDFPTAFLSSSITDNGAVIRLDRASTAQQRYITTSGKPFKGSFTQVYSAEGKSAPTDFAGIDIVGSAIKNNPAYYQAFISHNLDVSVVKGLAASNSGNLNTWSNKFVALWANMDRADDVLNNMFSNNPDDYYDNLLRYLDLLVVVNNLCNNTLWDYVKTYLKDLNRDGSDEFITIAAIGCVRSDLPSGNNGLIALPVYYSMVTRGSLMNYLHFERDGDTGSPVVPNSPGISYEGNPSAYIADMSDKYYKVKTTAASGYGYLWGNKTSIWWKDGGGGYGLAKSLLPTDLNGNGTGNCSYTFLAYREIQATPKAIAGAYTPPTGPIQGDDITNYTKINPMGQFSIEASSEIYEVPSTGGVVAALISVDLKQEAYQRQTIRQAYSAQIASGGRDTATLQIEYYFKCIEGTGDSGNFLDTAVFPTGMSASGVDKKTVVIPDLTWEKMATLLDGNVVVKWLDENINITECTTNRYYAKVTLIFNDGTQVQFHPTGKILDSADKYKAYDEVSWVIRKDELDKGAFYSTLRDGNYVEIKEAENPHYYEEFEAMAGVPTTEDLYVGFGANEFMANMECEKKTDTDKKRLYKFDKLFTNCVEFDEKCEYTCGGHSFTVTKCSKPGCTDNSDSFDCQSSSRTVTVSCGCGAKSQSFTVPAAKYVAGSKEHDGKHSTACQVGGGGTHSTGVGCEVTPKTNCAHPHSHTIRGTVRQKIDPFTYVDITAAELWRVSKLDYQYNKKLLDPFTNTWDPGTGFNAFVAASSYVSNNGRLAFSFVLPEDNTAYFGDTKRTYTPENKYILLEKAIIQSHKEFNPDIKGKKVQTTAISDFITMTTTEGYQTPTYNDQVAPEILITNQLFDEGGGSDNDIIDGNNIRWNENRTWNDLWRHDTSTAPLSSATPGSGGVSYSSYKWKADHITRSGYNGKYNQPTKKYENINETDTVNPAKQWENYNGMILPNMLFKVGSTSFAKSTANMRMTKTPLNIIDSTQKTNGQKGIWSDSDSKEPVSNGEWDTGNCYLTANKVVDFSNPKGRDWATKGTDYFVEVGYTKGKAKVNNVVIHNPVSVQNAEVIGGADKPGEFVDQRSGGAVGEGGDPTNRDNGVCPGDYTCQFRTLDCHDPEAGHECKEDDPKCYVNIGGKYKCNGDLNAHEHEPKCYTAYEIIAAANGSSFSREIGGGTYYIEIAGGAGGGDEYSDGYPGYIVRGTINVSGTTEVNVNLGTAGEGDTPGYPDGNGGSYTDSGKCASGGSTVVKIGSTILCAPGGCGFAMIGSDEHDTNINMLGYSPSNTLQTSGLDNITIEQASVSDGYIRMFRCLDDGTEDVDMICGYATNWSIDTETGEYVSTCDNCGEELRVPEKSKLKNIGSRVHIKTRTVNKYNKEEVEACDGKLNIHKHTSSCAKEPDKLVYICMNPHHHKAGEAWDPSDVQNHNTNSNLCWKPCNDNSKHQSSSSEISGSGGSGGGANPAKAPEYINLDRKFSITYPATGDFAENPSLWGILDTTKVRGRGYYNGMDCEEWTRDKFVTFTVDVIDENGKLWKAGTPINVYDIHSPTEYVFYCPLENLEQSYGSAEFVSIATNAAEVEYYNENKEVTNAERSTFGYAARHTAYKCDFIDVVGYIGSLTINDTGDVRFAELFKKPYPDDDEEAGWLIPNVVKKVRENVCNKLVIDDYNVRQDKAVSQWYHDIYSSGSGANTGTLYNSTGGKHYANVSMPLTPKDNPIKSLQNQPMRPGYNLLMDIQTVGNYYGENRKIDMDEDGNVKSSQFVDDASMIYKMQIVPKYQLLDLNTGTYMDLDVYMGVNSEYEKVNSSDWLANPTNSYKSFKLYLNWLQESARRNYTRNEQGATSNGVTYFSGVKDSSGHNDMGAARSPQVTPDVLGDAQRLFLNDLDRTFVGGQYTYGTLHNGTGDDAVDNSYYVIQAQRWHFTLGLPSSAVFVQHGKKCTTTNIDAIRKKDNAAIVCSANIKVRGEVWTLEYDGKNINTSDTDSSGRKGFQIVPKGPAYKAPSDDPVIVVYSNKYTSKDDLRTEGTH